MAENDEFDEFDEAPEGESDKFREMRARANQAKKLQRENATLTSENAALSRQIAFSSAGLALNDKQQAALIAAHGDADLTADALRATAIELGFAQPVPDEDETQRTQALQAQGQIAAAQAGGQPPAPLPDLDTQILAAEQAGEWSKAVSLKSQKLASLRA